jgi:hypothetical protein
MRILFSGEIQHPGPDREAAVRAVLSRAGWYPDGQGALATVLADLFMILDASGREREVADYLRAAGARQESGGGLERFLPLAAAIVQAYHGREMPPAV